MPVVQLTQAECRVFEALGEKCGVFLWNPASEQSGFRFREDWASFAGEEAEVLREIADDLPSKAQEMEPQRFLHWVDETLSNTFRILSPLRVLCHDFDRTLQAVYRKQVSSTVQQFVTHLPLYSLRAAAGGFSKTQKVEAEDWVDTRIPGHRLNPHLFLARIQGRSMEPDIPDGSLCVFRWYSGGSRTGKIVLVARQGEDSEVEVTIKRYRSGKRHDASGSWQHDSIEMQPGNPEFERWQLQADESHQTLAEFVCVLEDPDSGVLTSE